MTVNLRTTSNAKATNKGSALSHAELDGNFVHFLDTGITVVGDDSSGTEFTPGDDIKIAGANNISTAVSGPTLTITGSLTPTFTSVAANSIGVDSLNLLDNKITSDTSANIEIAPGGSDVDIQGNLRINETYTEDINTLTDSSTITVDCNLAPIHKVTLGGNRQFVITNLSTGQTVTIIITQDGSGNRTGSFGDDSSTAVKFAGGTPSLSTAAAAIDVVTITNDGSNKLGNIAKAYAA